VGADNSVVIGDNTNVCAPNTIVLGSNSTGPNQGVVLGNCQQSFGGPGEIEIRGGGSMWVSGTQYTSDRRLKENIEKITSPLNTISQLNGYTYTYKQNFEDFTFAEGRKAGVMAQELNDAFPFPVKEGANGYYGVDYVQLIPLLLEGIKEQQEEIDELKSRFGTEEGESSNFNPEPSGNLAQNNPNPFSSITKINYEIYGAFNQAEIRVYNMSGELRVTKPLLENNASVIIEGNFLEPGIYAYTLIVDGTSVETKTMVVSK
jgi:hypothetical protein